LARRAHDARHDGTRSSAEAGARRYTDAERHLDRRGISASVTEEEPEEATRVVQVFEPERGLDHARFEALRRAP